MERLHGTAKVSRTGAQFRNPFAVGSAIWPRGASLHWSVKLQAVTVAVLATVVAMFVLVLVLVLVLLVLLLVLPVLLVVVVAVLVAGCWVPVLVVLATQPDI